MTSDSERVREWQKSLGYCTWPEGCTRHAANKTSMLCANHYGQTPAGRDLKLRQKYGLRLGEFDELMEQQGGKCGICFASETTGRSGKPTPLNVDHDHATGAVRGLLCSNCNRALGMFKDNAEYLSRAILWLDMEFIDDTKIQWTRKGGADAIQFRRLRNRRKQNQKVLRAAP
jgi:hypothetical protein